MPYPRHFAGFALQGLRLANRVVQPSTAGRNRKLTEAYNGLAVESLGRKATMMHEHGCVVFGQLVHLGREWPVGGSDIPPIRRRL